MEMWATQQNEKCGKCIKGGSEPDKTFDRHEKNLQEAVWWGWDGVWGRPGPAGAHRNGLTAQYAAAMADKMGPCPRN